MAIHHKRIITFLLIVVLYDFQFVSAGETLIKCIKKEREALLRFKQALIDDKDILSSWGSEEECCKWEGVECSNTTGHVTSLGTFTELPNFRGKFSSALLELHHLNYLDLSWIDFGGIKIPEFIGSIKSLEYLSLSWCNFSGFIPPQLGNLTNLRILDLQKNQLDGPIPEFIGSIKSLEYLSLSWSNFSGFIPPQLGNLTNLRILDLQKNQLDGPIPDSFENLISLEVLYLNNNKLTGSVPTSLGQLSSLEKLYVSHNSLTGIISEAHFVNLHNLASVSLSFNALILRMGPDWVPPVNLIVIDLVRCKIGPSFPAWLQRLNKIVYLDISDNGISDEVPKWFWNLSSNISVEYLNISQNQISGTIPDFSINHVIYILDVSSNIFSGPLPLFHLHTYELRFNQNKFSGSISSICTSQSQLELLDLSNNMLSGAIPDCWENMTSMFILNLSNNSFSGEIPHSFGSLGELATLHLRNNNLSGELPSNLKNCLSLRLIDFGGNELTGNIPSWLGSANYTDMTLLNLRQNRFYGGIPLEICHLTHIQILDLSENHISGEIPQCFNNFTSFVDKNYTPLNNRAYTYLSKRAVGSRGIDRFVDYALVQWKGREWEYRNNLLLLKLIDLSSNRLVGSIPGSFSSLIGLISLNLSSNSLIGNIIPDIGQMEMLEVLDLSRNQLSGEIPTGMARLSFLAAVNLANNNLSGEIPSGPQLQGLSASAYAGNNGLCGRPLPLCLHNTSNNNQGQHIKNKVGLREFWIALVFGAIVGFWGVVGSLVLKRSWRYAYFNFLDVVGDWLYGKLIIFLSKFRRG